MYEPHYKECPAEGRREQDGRRIEVGGPGCECNYIQRMMEQQAEDKDAEQGHEDHLKAAADRERQQVVEGIQLRDQESRQLAADARHEEAELRRQEGITLESYGCGCRKENGTLIIACQNHHEEWAERG